MRPLQLVLLIVVVGGITTLGIVLPLTVDTSPPMAATGFPIIDPLHGYVQKVCPTQKDWTSQLATNERTLSNQYFDQPSNVDVPDARGLNTLAVVWGQFIDHDIVLTITDPETKLQIEFLNVTRTIKDPLTGESRTLLSPGIDGSTVYGDYANPDTLQWLRVPNSCLMKTSSGPSNDGPLLPLNHSTPQADFMAGDERSDEHAPLTSIHTLFVREHNRLCGELPSEWSPEQRFWKARQIVIAIIHHITYREWLPALMGSQYALLSDPLKRGHDTRITDVFAGAAFRFGHSMIPNQIGVHNLMEMFFNINLVQTHGIGYFLEAAATTPAQACDLHIVDGLRNIMFGPPGEDLVTRNLFRARDMGLPTYAEICHCYNTPIQPLSGGIIPEDPMLGMLNEPLIPGSSLPRTIAVVLAEQFARLQSPAELSTLGSRYAILVERTNIGTLIKRNTQITEHLKFFI